MILLDIFYYPILQMIGDAEGTTLAEPITRPAPVPVRNKLLMLRAKEFKSKGFGLGIPLAGKADCRLASRVG
jgi:hypothetical protein